MPHPLETEWGIEAPTILDAVYYCKGYTKRGVRGIVAECAFASRVLNTLPEGWTFEPGSGNDAIDFVLHKEQHVIRVQVKLQRMEGDAPMIDRHGHPVVECQKSQGRGEKRSYHYGDFEILAVSLWPSTKDWNDFVFAAAHQLPHKPRRPRSIKTMLSAPLAGDDVWTRDFQSCLERAAGKQAIRQTHEQLLFQSPAMRRVTVPQAELPLL